MCPVERIRHFPSVKRYTKDRFDKQVEAVAGFFDTGDSQARRDFETCLTLFEMDRDSRPYGVTAKRVSLKVAKTAFRELLVALENTDYESRRKLESYAESLSKEAKAMLAERRHALQFTGLMQDLIRMWRIWTESIDLYLNDLPQKGTPGRHRQTARDRLIQDLRVFFSDHGRARRQRTFATQERLFIAATLAAVDEPTVEDFAERIRKLPSSKQSISKRKKGRPAMTKKPVET